MEEKRFLKRYYLIFFSVLIGPFSTSITIPIFEQLRINFGLSTLAQVSISFSFFMFPYAILQLFTGSFSDIVNKKLVVMGGFIIFIFGLFLALISVFLKTFILYLIALFMGGIGFSFINPTVLAILGIITPESKRGWIMGIYSSAAGIGIITGSILSRFLAKINWFLIFIILPFISIIVLFLFMISIKSSELSIESSVSNKKKDTLSFKSVLKDTFTQLKEGINWNITLIGMCGFFTFFTTITLTNTINEQLRISLETYSESEIINYTSSILTLTGITSIIISPIAGILTKRIKEFNLIIFGFILLSLILFFPFGQLVLYYEIFSILIYIGYAVIWPALFKITVEISPDKRGINSGIVNMLRFLGYSLVGPLYTLIGIPILFYIALILDLIGIIIIIVLKKRKLEKV